METPVCAYLCQMICDDQTPWPCSSLIRRNRAVESRPETAEPTEVAVAGGASTGGLCQVMQVPMVQWVLDILVPEVLYIMVVRNISNYVVHWYTQ